MEGITGRFGQSLKYCSSLLHSGWGRSGRHQIYSTTWVCRCPNACIWSNVYIRVTTSNACSSHLLASKTRVAPLNGETIPRLQLMAALTLANLIKVVYEALIRTVKVNALFIWTASRTVWWWINRESPYFKQFVHNRVQKIRSLWGKEHWRSCPSELTSGDIASRGVKSSSVASSDLWWKGAPFLGKEEVHWPNLSNCPIGGNAVPEEAAKELMKERAPKISRVFTVQCNALRSQQTRKG